MIQKKSLSDYVPELLAMIFYGLPLGSFVLYIEKTKLEFTFVQLFWTHAIYLSHYLAFHLCAAKKDQLAERMGEIVASTIVLCLICPPVFFVSAKIAGTSWAQASQGALLQVGVNACLGWLYYCILEGLRYFKKGTEQAE
jgi:hypothetical protein